jgi:co-chaperonin GroES (HSP10)
MNDQASITTPVATYTIVEWVGRNTSGIQPFGERVLILPDQPAAEVNGIAYPAMYIERAAEAAETGVMVALGESAWAWNGDRSRRYEGVKPAPGARVYFERYAGAKFKGRDGLLYRLMEDKSVGGFAVEPEGEIVESGPAAHEKAAKELQDAITGN